MAKPPVMEREHVEAAALVYWTAPLPKLDTVAAQFNVSRGTLARWFRTYHVPIRKRGGGHIELLPLTPYERTLAQHIDFHYHGFHMTQQEVAETLHLRGGRAFVGALMRRAGIPTRHRREYPGRYTVTDEERDRRSELARRRWADGDTRHIDSANGRRPVLGKATTGVEQ